MNSLSIFLRQATSDPQSSTSSLHDTAIPLWYLSTSFSAPESFKAFEGLLSGRASETASRTCVWVPDGNDETEHFAGTFPLVADPKDKLPVTESLHDLARIAADIERLAETESRLDDHGAGPTRLISVRPFSSSPRS